MTIVVGYVPTALLADRYPTPSPWTECGAACPDNAFQIVDAEPRFVVHGLPAARELVTILLFLGVATVLSRRVRTATHLTRIILTPVLIVATVRLVVYAGAIAVRRASPDAPAVDVLAWTLALLIPVMAIGFLVGLVRWRMFAGGALERLALDAPQDEARDHRRVLVLRILTRTVDVEVSEGDRGDVGVRRGLWCGERSGK